MPSKTIPFISSASSLMRDDVICTLRCLVEDAANMASMQECSCISWKKVELRNPCIQRPLAMAVQLLFRHTAAMNLQKHYVLVAPG